jgi:hypothetical protein
VEDWRNTIQRYRSDWFFNQLILASAVYLFFTNLLPGITFASDLNVLTKQHYGAIEVVFSTGLCGCIFALLVSCFIGNDSKPPLSVFDRFSSQPLTILGVTGPFCILSERIFALCDENFHVRPFSPCCGVALPTPLLLD